VWILGIFPVWIFAAVDYHGSRLVAFRLLINGPTATAVAEVLGEAFARYGAPRRVITDRGTQFTSETFAALLRRHGVRHALCRPAHPWTNGRIERIFRTFKETVFRCVWLFRSRKQIARFCADFLQWYNRDRPHSGYSGKTPDEVYFGKPMKMGSAVPIRYFDGRLRWFRFG